MINKVIEKIIIIIIIIIGVGIRKKGTDIIQT